MQKSEAGVDSQVPYRAHVPGPSCTYEPCQCCTTETQQQNLEYFKSSGSEDHLPRVVDAVSKDLVVPKAPPSFQDMENICFFSTQNWSEPQQQLLCPEYAQIVKRSGKLKVFSDSPCSLMTYNLESDPVRVKKSKEHRNLKGRPRKISISDISSPLPRLRVIPRPVSENEVNGPKLQHSFFRRSIGHLERSNLSSETQKKISNRSFRCPTRNLPRMGVTPPPRSGTLSDLLPENSNITNLDNIESSATGRHEPDTTDSSSSASSKGSIFGIGYRLNLDELCPERGSSLRRSLLEKLQQRAILLNRVNSIIEQPKLMGSSTTAISSAVETTDTGVQVDTIKNAVLEFDKLDEEYVCECHLQEEVKVANVTSALPSKSNREKSKSLRVSKPKWKDNGTKGCSDKGLISASSSSSVYYQKRNRIRMGYLNSIRCFFKDDLKKKVQRATSSPSVSSLDHIDPKMMHKYNGLVDSGYEENGIAVISSPRSLHLLEVSPYEVSGAFQLVPNVEQTERRRPLSPTDAQEFTRLNIENDPGDSTVVAPPPGFGEPYEALPNAGLIDSSSSAKTEKAVSLNKDQTRRPGISPALHSFCSEMLEQRPPSYTGHFSSKWTITSDATSPGSEPFSPTKNRNLFSSMPLKAPTTTVTPPAPVFPDADRATQLEEQQSDNLIEEISLDKNERHFLSQGGAGSPAPSLNTSPRGKQHSQSVSSDEDVALAGELFARCKSRNGKGSDSSQDHLSATDEIPLRSDTADSGVASRPGSALGPSGQLSPQIALSPFVVVAIDFGTTYSGYAYSFTRDPESIHIMRKWEGGDPGILNQKTPTSALLTPEGEFHSFGFAARDHFHDLDVEQAKKWLYFDKFKMTLHSSENLTRDTEIRAVNGRPLKALAVFSMALRHFRDQALREVREAVPGLAFEDIRWVITVPAIWRQPAKQFIRAAAYKAGIGSPENPERVVIALEPEVASVYCRKLKVHQLMPDAPPSNKIFFLRDHVPDLNLQQAVDEQQGTRYMVVDCGGGTVDITVHELRDALGTLKEIHKATGGPHGSVGVDLEFERLLCDVFGADFIGQYKLKRSSGWVNLMVGFEARKRSVSPYKETPLNISLPFSFIDYHKKVKGSSVESAIKKFGSKEVKWSPQGMLRLEARLMLALFRPTCEAIREHIAAVLDHRGLKNVRYLFLVGGFAESQVLQKAIRDEFHSKVKVIIPQGVSMAILRGAVLFGLDPQVIRQRRSRMTYGVGILNRFIPGVHPPSKKIVKDGVEWCADVFDKFVLADQSVNVGSQVRRSYTPAARGQSVSIIHIYCSDRDDVCFITDPGVQKCATLVLDLTQPPPPNSGMLSTTDLSTENDIPRERCVDDGRREIEALMTFGETEIKVSALDIGSGVCVKADVDFLSV
ncbi:uncharacterized protein LOC111252621 isoform X2 [Varroa destructor]|uniref:Heat shock 70 kDa protein 12A n=1 Tax=Varroa destructor TaxID=109461 RepID=A0A7M7KIV7_VARDE|nr:uncharacterized protein LOC111252621 isoform X2 [Varroa destructor]